MESICRKYNYPKFINVACSSYYACSMTWHEMAYLHFICLGHHTESGVSAWFWSTLCLVFDHGKSTLCLMFDNLLWAQVISTPCFVLMVGSVTWTMSKMSHMILRLSETVHSL